MNLETKRNAIMNAIASGGLPSEYQQVDYIESHSQGEYIDSGYIPNENTELDIEFSTATSTSDSNLYGVDQTTRFNMFVNTSSGRGFAFHIPVKISQNVYADTGWMVQNIQTNTFYSLQLSGLFKVFVNDTQYQPLQLTQSMYIFKSRGRTNVGSFKIKKFDISENGTLVRNFIPCYRIADNVVGMYDLVGQQFYTNQGGGAFTYGSEV